MSTISLTLDNEALAELYERGSASQQLLIGQDLIEDLAPAAGEHVLDVGCGTGLLADYVAGLVGPTGFVTGVDPLPLRIEIARKKTRPNLRFAVANAYDLSAFPAGSFDIVYLNAVFHWLPEKREPLRQFHRLLKPGGRLGLTTVAKGWTNPLQRIKERTLGREPYNRYPQALGGDSTHRVSAEDLRGLFEQTGFEVKKLDFRTRTVLRATADEVIRFSEASSFGNFLGHLPSHLREAAQADLARELEAFRTPEGFAQEAKRLYAVATKR